MTPQPTARCEISEAARRGFLNGGVNLGRSNGVSFHQICDQCGKQSAMSITHIIEIGEIFATALKNLPEGHRPHAAPNFCSRNCREAWSAANTLLPGEEATEIDPPEVGHT